MSVLINILRVVVVLFVVRLLGRALAAVLGPSRATPRRPQPADLDLVRDRVCNTHLPRDRAVRAMIGGREEYFCSETCRDRARALVSRAS